MPGSNRKKGYSPFGESSYLNNPVWANLSGDTSDTGYRGGVPDVMENKTPTLGNTNVSVPGLNLVSVKETPDYSGPETQQKAAIPSDGTSLTPTQAAIGAAPGVIGGLYGAFDAITKQSKLRKQDLVPAAIREGAGDAELRSKSGQVSNYGQQLDNITNTENSSIENSRKFASSGTQALTNTLKAQKVSNFAKMNLGERGRQDQKQNIARLDDFRRQIAAYDTEANNRLQNQYAAYDNAIPQNLLNAGMTAAQFAIMV